MVPLMIPQVLAAEEVRRLHAAMLSILSRTGCRIEHAKMRERFCAYGGVVDSDGVTVHFPEAVVEKFIAESQKVDYTSVRPSVGMCVGVYQGLYLDPERNEPVPFTEETLAGYIRLARYLSADSIDVLNYPVLMSSVVEPLHARLFAWQQGIDGSSSIQLTPLCPYILEMCEIAAQARQQPVSDIFRGYVYMLSPLRLSFHEMEQALFFHDRGLRVGLGSMLTVGGSGPVTLAGSLAVMLAESVVRGIFHRVLYGDSQWDLGYGAAPLDMRTMIQPYGRPELFLLNMAILQLARHYGASGSAHGGLSDAKRPSFEAGAQKMLTAYPCMLAGGGAIVGGLLSIDELFSPIQMILDADLVEGLKRVMRGFEINDETLAMEDIQEIGPGGFFTATEHTVRHFKEELWLPRTWSYQALSPWMRDQRKTDVDYAMDIWKQVQAAPAPQPCLDEDTTRQLTRIIAKAEKALLS